MAHYPRTTETGNFGRSLGKLEKVVGTSLVERKLLIIQQSFKLHRAEHTLLHLIKLMQQHEILINWGQLVRDARYWNKQSIVRWYEGLIAIRNHKKEAFDVLIW